MKTISHTLSPNFEEVQILPLADLHIGDLNANSKKINEWIDYILKTPNCFTILNGDLMNTAIRSSVGNGVYTDQLNPMEQLQQCVKLFGEIAEAGKILAIIQGNHENRIARQDSIDITELMARQLGVAEYYSPTSAVVFIRLGQMDSKHHNRPVGYSIYCVHGSGSGGRKEGGKLNRLADLANIVDADCYLMSHTHLPAIFRNTFYRTFIPKQSVEKVEHLFVNTSSSLDYGGYGEFFSYKPNSLEMPLIILNGRYRKIQAIL